MAAEDPEGGAVSQWEPREGGAPEAARRRRGVRPGAEPPRQGDGALAATVGRRAEPR